MKKLNPWLWIITLSGTGLAAQLTAQEQQDYQWRVVSPISATVVPLYNNAPSPFPKKQLTEKAAEDGPSAEEIALQRSILESTAQVEQLIAAPTALEPQITNLQVKAVMQGPQGWSALMNNRWLVKGAGFRVPVRAATSVQTAISQLAQMDQAASQRMSELLAKRLGQGTMDVFITKIDAQAVVVTGGRHSWQLPVRQAAD